MKKFYFATALAAFALASCTSDDIGFNTAQDVIEAQQSNAIQFGTYMGNQAMTRAGKTGNISTTELKASDGGFGVFAYYTGSSTYSDYRAQGTADKFPDFMYNQEVKWTTSNDRSGYIGEESNNMWAYSPLKYWPNDFANNTAVDDQDNNASNNPATGSATYGGNVSFFAYAPYVEATNNTTNQANIDGGAVTGNESGIIALSGNKYVGASGTYYSDPYVTWKMKSDGTNVVDLLWGTLASASPNVLSTIDQTGVVSTETTKTAWPTTETTYAPSILQGYTTAADLTKQKTNGTISFAFKHALAKVGGSEVNGPTPTGTKNHGLMIIADIDDQKGEEVGGHRGTTTGIDADTKITVKEITIKAKSKVKDASDKSPSDGTYIPSYLKATQGLFNLATGKWEITRKLTTDEDNIAKTDEDIAAAGFTHTINQHEPNLLNSAIMEPTTPPDKTESGFNGISANVPDKDAVNVYASDANPLVFIPGTWPELTVTVEYCVRTKDTRLANAYSQVWQKITKKITFTNPVELNKQYNLLIHLGLTSVKFTATVSDWDVETGTANIDTDGDGTPDATGKDIYVPINVQ